MNWKANKINVAIQVLPEADGKLKYELVDINPTDIVCY